MKQLQRYFLLFPETIDLEIFHFICNIWWFIVFSADGYFSGVTYVRALYYIGKSDILLSIGIILALEIIAFLKRDYVYISLIASPTMFLYLGIMGFIGTPITFTAVIFFLIVLFGAFRLFSFTYSKNNKNDDKSRTTTE